MANDILGHATANLDLLLRLRRHYGDLHTALVGEYIRANGDASVSAIALDLGVSRNLARRAAQRLSKSDSL